MDVEIEREGVKREGVLGSRENARGKFGFRRMTLRGKFYLLPNAEYFLPNFCDRLSLNPAAQTAVSRSKASFPSSGPILEKLDLFLSRSG